MTALLPLFLMLLAATAIWVSRKRAMSTQWGLSAALALLIWVSTLALRLGPDIQMQLSVWQPSEMFLSPLSLSLDQITWPIIYSLVTVLVAMIFTSASREAASTVGVKIFWFIYTASAILAILADNLLSVIITWTLFDFISAIFLFGLLREDTEIRQVLTRLSVDIFGVLLILAGSAFSITMGEGTNLIEPLRSHMGVLLIALGGFVRLGLMPLHFNLPSLLVTRRGLGTLLRFYPPAIVLAFLAKLFRAGVPDQTLPWFLIAGMSGIFFGGLRWILESKSVAGRPFFILALSGVGVLASASLPGNFMGVVSASIVLLLAGAVLSLAEIFTPSHRILALGAALVQLGIPILPASILLKNASLTASEMWPGLLWAIAIVIGVSLTTLGSLHIYFAEETSWRTGESLVRLTYGMGLSLPILTTIGIGIHLKPDIDLWSWIMLGIQSLLVVGGYVSLRNLPEGSLGRFRINISRLDPSRLYTAVGGALRFVLSGLRSVADLIEGEAAILWIFAIAGFLILALR